MPVRLRSREVLYGLPNLGEPITEHVGNGTLQRIHPRAESVHLRSVHSYYQEEWGNAWADYDPDQANALLDEVGMTERTRDGFRLAPGGEELQILIEYAGGLPVPAMELIKEYWEAVGVKVLLKVETGQSRNVTRTLNEHDVRASGIGEASETGQYITGGGEQFTCNRSRGVTADRLPRRQRA